MKHNGGIGNVTELHVRKRVEWSDNIKMNPNDSLCHDDRLLSV
jgi:hypothetical protein